MTPGQITERDGRFVVTCADTGTSHSGAHIGPADRRAFVFSLLREGWRIGPMGCGGRLGR